MDRNIEGMIHDYRKRQEMRNHPSFLKLKEVWDEGGYGDTKNTGLLDYLMKQVHENKTGKDPKAVVKLNEWVAFYINSGRKRLTEPDTYQSKQYYGRTLEELYDLAVAFMKDAVNRGFKVTEQGAINFVVISVIDNTFNEYVRCFNVIFKLRQAYPDFEFILTKPLETTEYGVDIIVLSGSDTVKALKVCPKAFYPDRENNEKSYKQKHDVFKLIYDTEVDFVYSTIGGDMEGGLPSF